MREQWKLMSWREKQLWYLIFLTAIAAVPQYILQSALIAPGGIAGLPPWFWEMDKAMWAVRALVEPWVIVYLFTTRSQSWWEKVLQIVLLAIEFGLLILIIVTVGPSIAAARLGIPPEPFMGIPWDWMLAAYTSLMMAGAGFAYRVQPEDVQNTDLLHERIDGLVADQLVHLSLHSDLRAEVAEMSQYVETKDGEITTLKEAIEQFSYLGSWFTEMDATNRARLLASVIDRDKLPAPKVLADAWGVVPSTIVKAYARGNENE